MKFYRDLQAIGLQNMPEAENLYVIIFVLFYFDQTRYEYVTNYFSRPLPYHIEAPDYMKVSSIMSLWYIYNFILYKIDFRIWYLQILML